MTTVAIEEMKHVLIAQVKEERNEHRPRFQTGGPLGSESPVYIERDADHLLMRLLQEMRYVIVVEPRQTGKTSLIQHAASRLLKSGTKLLYVDLTTVDRSTERSWYSSLSKQLDEQLRMSDTAFSGAQDPPIDARSFMRLLKEIVEKLSSS